MIGSALDGDVAEVVLTGVDGRLVGDTWKTGEVMGDPFS